MKSSYIRIIGYWVALLAAPIVCSSPHLTREKLISDIIVSGNKQVSTAAIIHRLPFKIGEPCSPMKTGAAIKALYRDLKRFKNITIKGRDTGPGTLELHIIIEEKYPCKDMIYTGNSAVTVADLNKKIILADTPAIDEGDLKKYVRIIKKLYIEKGYHRVDIDPTLIVHEDGTATAQFAIKEYKKSMVRRIKFTGNEHIPSKQLRKIILTREEWILSILDKAGTYLPDRLEGDRHFIEEAYQNAGFLHAKVTTIDVQTDPCNGQLALTYNIEEGEQYTIKEVHAPGNDILTEEQLLSALPVKPGTFYSRDALTNSIHNLEMIWGNRGYVYAHIEPSIIPDDESKTVTLAFNSEIGNKVMLNKVTIKGNRKTRDKVIRRAMLVCEGAPLTNYQMEESKNRIESLGYFDQREGVNWKMTRIADDMADLDLILKEAPTGNANIKISFGGMERDIKSPISGIAAEAAVSDRNLFGSGIQLNATGRLSRDERSFLFTLANPWLFDKPLFGKFDMYFKHLNYDEFRNTRPVNERDAGANITLGVVTGYSRIPWFSDTFIRGIFGVDSIRYGEKPTAIIRQISDPEERVFATASYQVILNKLFCGSEYVSLALNMGQDTRNHPIHPSRGHTWLLRGIAGLPIPGGCIAFHKVDLDFHWYTPLIDEHNLIFHCHSYLGLVNSLRNHLIPYRELFNIGGPASVRGFLFGQIAPTFYAGGNGDPIGGRKAFFWNAELQFPITPDFNMKGVFFYDGGTGWDNPYVTPENLRYIRNNFFDYRHSVGAGIRVYNPVPVRIDVGFKLDPRPGETPYEVHFGMVYDW